MTSFKDALDRDWQIRLFHPDIAALRELGFDLNRVKKDTQAIEVLADDEIFGRVIGYLCQEQIDKQKLSTADFLKGFDGETFWRAVYAIIGEFQSFCQPPNVAAAVRRQLPKVIEANERKLIQRIESIGSSSLDTSSPASPESTPLG